MKKAILILSLIMVLSLFAVLTLAKNNHQNGQECIQVITQAYNPKSFECRNFPTPCDVPKKWIIGNCPEITALQNENDINNTQIRECKKACKEVFTNSTHECSRVFVDTVHSCNDARNAAKELCQNLTGKEKRDCVKAANTASKLCKMNANIAKRQCKVNALTALVSCKETCEQPVI